MNMRIFWVLVLSLLTACKPQQEKAVDLYTSALFHDVQTLPVFPDSKTFVDCTPKRPLSEIIASYNTLRTKGSVDLIAFVQENFYLPQRPQATVTSEQISIEEHLTRLWPVLTRQADQVVAQSSLLPLPNAYVVPGGRFSEVYYWDSYFTQLGLNVHGKSDLIRHMLDNFSYLIDTLGHIPNGNRNYYFSRSQPPFFSLMVDLLQETDSAALLRYLPAMEQEYGFWMEGSAQLQEPGQAVKRAVKMPDGSILNRYWDAKSTPRPEAYKEDVKLLEESGRDSSIFRDLRAAAESGWDFSTRWFADARSLKTIRTQEIIPVDLNCLLVHLEQTLSIAWQLKGDKDKQAFYRRKASARRRALTTFFWNPEVRFFMDYDFVNKKNTSVKSLAGVYPLFFHVASPEQASDVANTIEMEFLKPGGVLTTLTESSQQWDAPNGWAPLQWITYKGLKNYKFDLLANSLRDRWLTVNERVYNRTGKMLEKYNVVDTTLVAGGGEYPNQDGFGWTNGVYLAMRSERQREKQGF